MYGCSLMTVMIDWNLFCNSIWPHNLSIDVMEWSILLESPFSILFGEKRVVLQLAHLYQLIVIDSNYILFIQVVLDVGAGTGKVTRNEVRHLFDNVYVAIAYIKWIMFRYFIVFCHPIRSQESLCCWSEYHGSSLWGNVSSLS